MFLGLPAVLEASGNPGGPAAVISCSSQGLPLPTWVHGDLTAENLLLQRELLAVEGEVQLVEGRGSGAERGIAGGASNSSGKRGRSGSGAGAPRVLLIDFADGGQGDPLWDLVPLYLRSFRYGNSGKLCITTRVVRCFLSQSAVLGSVCAIACCPTLSRLGCFGYVSDPLCWCTGCVCRLEVSMRA